MLLAYKYRCYPTPEQADMLARTFGCVRYVYNFGLALRRDAYDQRGERLQYKDTSAALTVLKKQSDGFPVLALAKMKHPLRVVWSRVPPSVPSTVTVSRDTAGRYFVSILCEVEPEPLPSTENVIGVDLGLTDLITTSDGEKIGNPKFLEADLRTLREHQRRLSRKKKGSNRWHKQRRKVARIHARIADKRKDFLHKLSTRLIRENQTVCLETLNVQGMMKNRRLSRHIGQSGWSEFVRQLKYKAVLNGRTVVKIDPWHPSSKLCSICKHHVKELPLSVRVWTCEACGASHDRDINAALNILAVGQTVIACGGNIRPRAATALRAVPVKRESSRFSVESVNLR